MKMLWYYFARGTKFRGIKFRGIKFRGIKLMV